jgi:hypothetical protein
MYVVSQVIHEFVKSCPIAAACGIAKACVGLEASRLEFRAVQVASYVEAVAKVELAWSVVTSEAKSAIVAAFTSCLRRTSDTSGWQWALALLVLETF